MRQNNLNDKSYKQSLIDLTLKGLLILQGLAVYDVDAKVCAIINREERLERTRRPASFIIFGQFRPGYQ
jgi:hypothetical protein